MGAPAQVGPPPTGGGPVPSLTERELLVLALVAQGFTHRQIGAQLVVTEKGVTPTVNRAIRKLGAINAPHAVFLACQYGLLDGRPQRHGDHAGFRAHERRGEDPWACTACAAGERAYRNARKATVRHGA